MRRLAICAPTAAGALAALAVAAAAAGAKVYGPQKCVKARLRPDPIVFACGYGGAYVGGIRWKHWSRDDARGVGTFYLRNSSGTGFHHYRARIRLDRIRRQACGGRTVPLFTEAILRFPKREPPGDWRRNRLFCAP